MKEVILVAGRSYEGSYISGRSQKPMLVAVHMLVAGRSCERHNGNQML